MCGIVGICGHYEESVETVKKMAGALVYRGPDAKGYWSDENGKVAFGHRRLAILDLSDAGAQPMQSNSGRYVLTYNGEIYNYREISEILRMKHALGVLHGSSDTEIILAAFEYWGIKEALKSFVGAFAMAVYDRKHREVYLIRDRMGEKPLYYSATDSNLIFASDINAIKPAFSNLPIDRQGLGLFFVYGYIPSPYSIYSDVKKLPGGHYLKYSLETEKHETTSYWSIEETAYQGHCSPFRGSTAEAKEELELLLRQSVKRQMISDVPLGAFLSGGIDSSLIVSMMQEQRPSEQIKTFSIGFYEDEYNEAPYAKEIARYLGTKHTELYLTKSNIIEAITGQPLIYGEPFADSSQIATYLVARLAKESVTVALSGDGGDEMFCGYPHYDFLLKRWDKIKKLPYSLRKYLGSAITRTVNWNDQLYRFGSQIRSRSIEELILGFPLKSHDQLICQTQGLTNSFVNISDENRYCDKEKMMMIDQKLYLQDDILVKLDRACMAVSLESRIPLLDKEIVEFSWRLPIQLKSSHGISKYILKELLYEKVPKGLLERPKSGFCVPLKKWLRDGNLYDWANDMIHSKKMMECEMIDYHTVTAMWDDFQNKNIFYDHLWNLLMFCSWYLEN